VTDQSTTEANDIAPSTSGRRDPSLAAPVATRAGWTDLMFAPSTPRDCLRLTPSRGSATATRARP